MLTESEIQAPLPTLQTSLMRFGKYPRYFVAEKYNDNCFAFEIKNEAGFTSLLRTVSLCGRMY